MNVLIITLKLINDYKTIKFLVTFMFLLINPLINSTVSDYKMVTEIDCETKYPPGGEHEPGFVPCIDREFSEIMKSLFWVLLKAQNLLLFIRPRI